MVPVFVNQKKSKEDFHLKKAILELEMAKNVETNRPTSQFLQATQDYNTARIHAEKMADELFPPKEEEEPNTTADAPSSVDTPQPTDDTLPPAATIPAN